MTTISTHSVLATLSKDRLRDIACGFGVTLLPNAVKDTQVKMLLKMTSFHLDELLRTLGRDELKAYVLAGVNSKVSDK